MDYREISNEALEQLAEKKDGEAICELGERCLYGRNGHVVDLNKAYQLFCMGENMGLARACVGLGEMYRNGIGFAPNENIAREYYLKAGVCYPENERAYTDGEQNRTWNYAQDNVLNNDSWMENQYQMGQSAMNPFDASQPMMDQYQNTSAMNPNSASQSMMNQYQNASAMNPNGASQPVMNQYQNASTMNPNAVNQSMTNSYQMGASGMNPYQMNMQSQMNQKVKSKKAISQLIIIITACVSFIPLFLPYVNGTGNLSDIPLFDIIQGRIKCEFSIEGVYGMIRDVFSFNGFIIWIALAVLIMINCLLKKIYLTLNVVFSSISIIGFVLIRAETDKRLEQAVMYKLYTEGIGSIMLVVCMILLIVGNVWMIVDKFKRKAMDKNVVEKKGAMIGLVAGSSLLGLPMLLLLLLETRGASILFVGICILISYLIFEIRNK